MEFQTREFPFAHKTMPHSVYRSGDSSEPNRNCSLCVTFAEHTFTEAQVKQLKKKQLSVSDPGLIETKSTIEEVSDDPEELDVVGN
jgi:hypothetical protein